MSGWVLFQRGQSQPPKTPRRRRAWGWVVLVFSAALAPFMVIGAVEAWGRLDILGALLFTFWSLFLVAGVVLSVSALIAFYRNTP